MRQHQLRGAIYCLIATTSWGAMFPVMTGALVRIDPFTFTSLRYLIAGAAFLAVLIFKEGWSAVHFKRERMLAAWHASVNCVRAEGLSRLTSLLRETRLRG